MTKRLSDKFFGQKKFTHDIYYDVVQRKNISLEQVSTIFTPYTQKLSEIKSEEDDCSLLVVFHEFVSLLYRNFASWEFQKLSTILELGSHVFEHSFENWLNKEDSFKYFTELMVRHSLFRPPHSIAIFNYEEMRIISEFWLANFHRFYAQYQQCMASTKEEILICHRLPFESGEQKDMKEGKLVQKSVIQQFLEIQ